MAKVLIQNKNTELDKFLEIHGRADYYGGSSVGTICGLNPFQTPYDLWLVKTGRKPAFEGNNQTRYGEIMESFILELCEFETMQSLSTYQDDERPWMICSPDGFTANDEVIECKAFKQYAENSFKDGKAPDHVAAQLIWNMHVLQKKSGYIACLIAGDTDKFYCVKVDYDPDIAKILIEKVEAFRQHVLNDSPPPVNHKDKDLITKYFAKEEDQAVDWSGDNEINDLVTAFDSANEEYKLLQSGLNEKKEHLDTIKNKIFLKANGTGVFDCDDRRIKVSRVKVKGHYRSESEYLKLTVK